MTHPKTLERPPWLLPLPDSATPYQHGITDPAWPVETPDGVSDLEYEEYRGRVARQDFCSIVAADVQCETRSELEALLRGLSDFAYAEMEKKASRKHLRTLDRVPETYRVTVTIGLGPSLFLTQQGDDRFGLRSLRPRALTPMPAITGDAPGFRPEDTEADLLIVICSDHPYVNIAIARSLAHGWVPGVRVRIRSIDAGFGRPDKREFLRFDDGIDNLRNLPGNLELDSLVYVQKADAEPSWCHGGSYLVYRKIRENVREWESLAKDVQEHMIGRKKDDGRPLSRRTASPDNMTPVFEDPPDNRTPLTAHIRKVQPRRPGLDLMGGRDLDRRFLRRPYPFFDGLDAAGNIVLGLQFLAFMKNIKQQFEWATQMWQMNPDFPVPGTGIDALFAEGILSTMAGGYYFCPPGRRSTDDFIGSELFV